MWFYVLWFDVPFYLIFYVGTIFTLNKIHSNGLKIEGAKGHYVPKTQTVGPCTLEDLSYTSSNYTLPTYKSTKSRAYSYSWLCFRYKEYWESLPRRTEPAPRAYLNVVLPYDYHRAHDYTPKPREKTKNTFGYTQSPEYEGRVSILHSVGMRVVLGWEDSTDRPHTARDYIIRGGLWEVIQWKALVLFLSPAKSLPYQRQPLLLTF